MTVSCPFPVVLREQAQQSAHLEELAEEVAVEIRYNGRPYLTLMASPQELPELALGLSLSEGILRSVDELGALNLQESGEGWIVDLLTTRALHLRERRESRTSCGLCGIQRIADLPQMRRQHRSAQPLSVQALTRALLAFKDQQTLHRATGATHAAAWVDFSGTIGRVCEDLGRHNALDKLIGDRARRGGDWQHHWLLLSSRASFEMVQKASTTEVAIVVALSAATARAVRLAQAHQITLIGFARPEHLTIYSHPERIEESS